MSSSSSISADFAPGGPALNYFVALFISGCFLASSFCRFSFISIFVYCLLGVVIVVLVVVGAFIPVLILNDLVSLVKSVGSLVIPIAVEGLFKPNPVFG
jgi:hypothetical protein